MPQITVLIGCVVLLLVIGVRSLPQIGYLLAPSVVKVEPTPPRLDEHKGESVRRNDDEKIVGRNSSEGVENLHPSKARSLANPLPFRASPVGNTHTALSTAPAYGVPVDEQDPTLENEIVSPTWEEQDAQEQYLREVEATEEVLQREFDPTTAPPELTAEQVAEIEAEIQENVSQQESLPQMLQDLQPDG